jgi:DNA-3-methyladenine glycosylase II
MVAFLYIIHLMLDQAILHLSKDSILAPILTKYPLVEYSGGRGDYFLDLVEIVTGQQLSIKASDSIFKRFLGLFSSTLPSPDELLTIPTEQLRSVGLSAGKVKYIQNIALAIKEGSLPVDKFDLLPDEAVFKAVTSVKGLGPWSAEMFLMFSLRRPDIFSVGDLGIRTAIARLYGVDREDKQAIIKLSESWSPYRTYACRLLWASLENK